MQGSGSKYPDFLWDAEQESSQVIYPFRIPVSFEGGPRTRARCINWQSLAQLQLKGHDGCVLESPQQWGIKFTTNILEAPDQVDAFLALIISCAAPAV